MLVEDRASVEAEFDERDPSRLRIDIRVHPIGGGSFGSEAGGMQRRFARGSAMPCVRLSSSGWRSPRTRSRSGEAGSLASSVSSFVWGSGPMATIALTQYHPRSGAVASLDELGSAAAAWLQSNPIPVPAEPAPPQWVGPASPSEGEHLNRLGLLARPRARRVPGHLACTSNNEGAP